MKAEKLQDLFERGLEFAYDGEQQILKALPAMAEAASSGDLRDALEQHLEKTQRHSDRLERIFASLDRATVAETNHAIHGILNESHKMIKHIDRSALLDAALIVGGTQLEHHKIALYGSLCSFARILGLKDSVVLLEQTLDEERLADRALTRIGEDSIYHEASTVVTVNHEFNFI